MTVLRVYDPVECGQAGVPLDWERCRNCRGGEIPPLQRFEADIPPVPPEPGTVLGTRTEVPCPTCGGHGSLKAAALHALAKTSDDFRAQAILSMLDANNELAVRCEDCGHPMSEGTWEGEAPDDATAARYLVNVADMLRDGIEPESRQAFYSPCDGRCRHGGEALTEMVAADAGVRASWRPVDVRTLGWPHDLRPEKLAVLCLRCFTERSDSRDMIGT